MTVRAERRAQFRLLFLLGLTGIIALAFELFGNIRAMIGDEPALAAMPTPLLVILSLLQPTALLAVAVWAGIRMAPQVGLRSHLASWATNRDQSWPRFHRELGIAITAGVAAALAIIALDASFQPFLSAEWKAFEANEERDVRITVTGVLYGGITEELMMRWGLMTFVAWAAWRALRHRYAVPPAFMHWLAIAAAALIFGLGHLPALPASVELDSVLVVRTILLNAVAGLVFGWLYWRYRLEAAMIAHSTAHLVFTAAAVPAS